MKDMTGIDARVRQRSARRSDRHAPDAQPQTAKKCNRTIAGAIHQEKDFHLPNPIEIDVEKDRDREFSLANQILIASGRQLNAVCLAQQTSDSGI